MTTPETTFPCQFLSADGRAAAVSLNQACLCNSLNHDGLQRALDAGRNPSLPPGGLTTPPHLFSDSRVFVGENDLKFMADLIAAIERVIALPAWREMAFAQAPAIARYTPTAKGVFLGYDFHLGENGPQLIEINTNAGGALLNAKLLRAQYACGPGSEHVPHVNLEAVFLAMFRLEWRLARGDRPLLMVVLRFKSLLRLLVLALMSFLLSGVKLVSLMI